MGFVFERRARSRKARSGLRSWLGKPPAADKIKDRIDWLLPRLWKDGEIAVTTRRIVVRFDPRLPPLHLVVAADAALELRVPGEPGPGYCDHAMARLAPLLDELDYAWDPAADPRAEACAWLAGELRAGATRIAMPPERRFVVDQPAPPFGAAAARGQAPVVDQPAPPFGAAAARGQAPAVDQPAPPFSAAVVQTALGPRDAAWRAAVLADPSAGRDAFAWWDDRPGCGERARALLAMWHEVPWREPIDQAERAVMAQVDADLRAARAADPELALPYAEWAELVGHLGDAERADKLAVRAAGPAAIGYRRFDMEVEIDDAWSIVLPGSFVGRWEDDPERYWASDGVRLIELITMATTERDSAALLAVAPARHPVIERIADGDRHGRAEAHDEHGVHIIHGLVAVAPHVAILTCKTTLDDEPWALATWRSLRARAARTS